MRLLFLTSTPQNIRQGSGTFAGISTLAAALRRIGHEVRVVAPARRFPILTAQRLWFNEQLRFFPRHGYDRVVGFDMDGYRIAGRGGPLHVAAIKGVIADEARFESGLTRATLALQARCEALHVERAGRVLTTSRYSARRIEALYNIPRVHGVVPELIDLAAWRELFARYPAAPDPERFTVLSVCRFYPRKRLHLLLRAAALVRPRLPDLEIRIVGGGPEAANLHRLWRDLALEGTVHWLGDVSGPVLAQEYNRARLFCLPSVQEGFGIVFLEAMAAGKPILAARAAAAGEVLPQGLLVEPESHEALAGGLLQMHEDSGLRRSLAGAGAAAVENYDAPRVAAQFLAALE